MRRGWIIFFLFLYMIPTIGVSIASHHCGGKVASISLKFFDIGHKCPCGSKPMKKGCCKDEVKTFKLESEQQKANQLAIKLFETVTFQPVITEYFAYGYQRELILANYSYTDNPPDDLKHPLYLQKRVFRI